MGLRQRPVLKSGLITTLESCSRRVKREPVRTCDECGGRKVARYETYEGGFDRTFEDQKCHGCGGKGTIGGGQPGLHLYFQTEQQRKIFKAAVAQLLVR